MYELVAFLGKVMASRYGEAIDDAGWFCGGILVTVLFLIILGALRVAKQGEALVLEAEAAGEVLLDAMAITADKIGADTVTAEDQSREEAFFETLSPEQREKAREAKEHWKRQAAIDLVVEAADQVLMEEDGA